MGKVENFLILLAKPNAIYFGGEALKGQMNFVITERFKINSVKLNISGQARVHWTEQQNHNHGGRSHTRTVSYSAYETYLNFDIVFLSKQSGSDLYLEPGNYSYPFEVILPPNLPTSYEHYVGQIRYSVNGTIDIPWAFDKHTKRSFTVVSHLDLNVNPALRQGYGVSGEKVICCGPCKQEPITAEFGILKGGYVPGEAIVFNITIHNRSNREIKEMTVNLIQKTKFHATTKTRVEARNVASIKFPKRIAARDMESWKDSVLVIPPVCHSSNGTCRIIDVSYEALFNFDASGGSISTDLKIPIVIGTIPLNPQAGPPPNGFRYTFEGCMFGPNPVEIPSGNEGGNKGEIVSSDANTYVPFYPYYKDFSVQNVY